jgi:glutamate-1-semialdehyde aminotransferase
MQLLEFEAAEIYGFEKIPHQGTFNANPLSAAAGTDGDSQADRRWGGDEYSP